MNIIPDTNVLVNMKEKFRNSVVSERIKREMAHIGLERLYNGLGIKSVVVEPLPSCIQRMNRLDFEKVYRENKYHIPSKLKMKIDASLGVNNIKLAWELMEMEMRRKKIPIESWERRQERIANDCSLISTGKTEEGEGRVIITRDENLYNVCKALLGKDRCKRTLIV